jgi:hypothetical protein
VPGRSRILIVHDFSFEKMVQRVHGAYSIFCDKFLYKDKNSEYLISDNEAFMDVLATANRHEVVMCCVVDQKKILKKRQTMFPNPSRRVYVHQNDHRPAKDPNYGRIYHSRI